MVEDDGVSEEEGAEGLGGRSEGGEGEQCCSG